MKKEEGEEEKRNNNNKIIFPVSLTDLETKTVICSRPSHESVGAFDSDASESRALSM